MSSGKPQDRWLGGYCRHGKRGTTFIIERWVGGVRYHVSTRCRTERAALAQLAAFEADPVNYRPGGARKTPLIPRHGVSITADLILEYRKWMLEREKPATDEHSRKHVACLRDWMLFYGGRPIRDVRLAEVAAHVAPLDNRAMRIQALKSYCAWLRRVKFVLERNEDPTIDLQPPRRRATKDVRQVAIEPERILRVLPHLPDEARDAMILRLGTGWHYREVVRFAAGGVIHYTPGKFVRLMTEEGAVRTPLLATLQVRQKISVETNTPILYPEHLAAAERIRQRGHAYHETHMRRLLARACASAGVDYFWNWHVRHSVVSHAIESGADLEHASVFVDHLNTDTTRTHYRQLALPKQAVPVVRVPND